MLDGQRDVCVWFCLSEPEESVWISHWENELLSSLVCAVSLLHRKFEKDWMQAYCLFSLPHKYPLSVQ